MTQTLNEWREFLKRTFKEIFWLEFIKGGIMATAFSLFVALPWVVGFETLFRKAVASAGYTEDKLASFHPTVLQWWLAEHGTSIILVLVYAVVMLGAYTYLNKKK